MKNVYENKVFLSTIKKKPESDKNNSSKNCFFFLQGCHACGSGNCNRHDPEISSEPWTKLQIHKQLDQAIEDVRSIKIFIMKLNKCMCIINKRLTLNGPVL